MTVTETGQHRLLLDHLQVGVMLHAPSSEIIYCNDEASRILGYTRGELESKSLSDNIRHFISENGERLSAELYPFYRILKDPTPLKNLVLGIVHPDGRETTWVRVNAYAEFGNEQEITQIVVVMMDITEQKRTTENYRLKRHIFESAVEGILLTDVRQPAGLIICTNPAFSKISGYSEKEIVGKSFDLLYGPDTGTQTHQMLHRIAVGATHETTLRLYKKNGECFWCFLRIAPAPDLYGAITHYTWHLYDVTQQKEITDTMASNRQVIEQAKVDLEAIIAAVPDILLRFNSENRFTFCHSSQPGALSIPAEKLLMKRFEEILPPRYLKPFTEQAEKARMSGMVEAAEYEVRYDNIGNIKWYEARMVQGYDDEILCVIRHITDQKRAENALRESEQLLRDIFNLAPVPLVLSRIADGKIIMVNDAVEKLLGLPFSSFSSLKTLDFYKDMEQRAMIVEEMNQKGYVRNLEVKFKRPSGQSAPCLLSSKLVIMNSEQLLFSGIVDISERIKAEEERKLNEQLLRDVFNYSPIAFIITDIASGEIIMVNEAAAKLTGLDVETVTGKHVSEFYANPFDREQLLAKISAHGKGEMEIALKNVKDNSISFGIISTGVININGEKRLFSGFINITERKKMEADLNVSLELVREQNKRLLNFSYIVSHNLRSHTSNIKTILDFIENASSPAEREEMIMHLRTVTGRLDATLHDLNEVVSIQKNINLIVIPLQLYDYVYRAQEVLNEQIHLKNAIINNYVPKEMIVNYNPAYLESILLNFLSNAIKYSHPNRQCIVNVKCIVGFDKTILEITDNGLGIDLVKNKDKIFGMYKTFHGNKDAKGLGLFISKNQVEAMSGTVEVESQPDVGTTFKISII